MATKKKENTAEKQLKVTLVKSTIGSLQKHKATVQALGLKKIRSSVVVRDNAAMRGMIFAVKHLVTVEEV
ncbi:MAG: 50S ribosomal protein L30 [Clostridiales bacterium]|nr:50S ribosomal protein L30 [Clostridiales bacterium]